MPNFPERSRVNTDSAPSAIGPYSQAIKTGDLLFMSGQIPLDPETGDMVGGEDVSAQTHQVMQNLEAVLAEAGSAWGQVVRTTIYLTDLADFATVNAIYGTVFENLQPPARACVQVAALPKGAKVEIDAIARLPSD